MAEGTKLQLTFDTMSGSRSFTFANAKPSATASQVKALGAAMIENGSIYDAPPLVLRSAKTITTSENEFDIS